MSAPRRFVIGRDVGGGTIKPVAEGVRFSSGQIAINWLPDLDVIEDGDGDSILGVVLSYSVVEWLDPAHGRAQQAVDPGPRRWWEEAA